MSKLDFKTIVNQDIYETTATFDIGTAVFTAVWLQAYSDLYDNLVWESTDYVFNKNLAETKGRIFFLSDPVSNACEVFIVQAPDCVESTFAIVDEVIKVKSNGYPIIHGFTTRENAEKFCRDWYKTVYQTEGLHTMSNTWADFRDRTRVRADFLMKEIDAAQELGVDVVQIDDGWQSGTTPPPCEKDGSFLFSDEFWLLNDEAFPHGMEQVSSHAKERGVKLGLWFAPQSVGPFGRFQQDLAVLKKAYEEWGIRYFKLDFLQLWDKARADAMCKFIESVLDFGKDATVELDVTADKRLGYLNSAPYGTLFVENRYTKTTWGNYYPHKTLRNLWRLSKYIPSSKLQFEFMNPGIYTESYKETDLLRPALYDIDYLFATVMVSNPLFWMETQFLSQDNRKKLKPLVAKWKTYRAELSASDIFPIGNEPCGASLCGFHCESNHATHLVLFREVCKSDTMTLQIPKSSCEVLYSNDQADVCFADNVLTVKFNKQRAYVWLRLE
ncbi:MAG: alpha-galactosidase [Oscillospiraceae bacterium]|nr:alpha-galactosidase [Oscillospiraceae bacterium]